MLGTPAHQKLSLKAINSIKTVMGVMPDLPAEFIEDLDAWARGWPHHRQEAQSSDRVPAWCHARPYHVSMLAKQPGMPGETTLYKLLKELSPEDRARCRNLGGQLTPKTVQWIIGRVAECKGRGVKDGGKK